MMSPRRQKKKSLLRKIEEKREELCLSTEEIAGVGIPVLVVVEGFGAAGKGTIINHMIQPLDPRGLRLPVLLLQIEMSNYVLFFEAFGGVLHPLIGWRFLIGVGTEVYWMRRLMELLVKQTLRKHTRMCVILRDKCVTVEQSF